MDDLIAALTILRKYGNPSHPTGCGHDELSVFISPKGVSDEDRSKLESLGFHADDRDDRFYSFRYGSA